MFPEELPARLIKMFSFTEDTVLDPFLGSGTTSSSLERKMAKEWILNSAMNRFQLNFKRNVGPTSESIRMCAPKTLNEVINEIKQEIERLRK